MANIALRRNRDQEQSSAPISTASSFFPSAWSRTDPYRLMNRMIDDFLGWDPFRELSPAWNAAPMTFSPDLEIDETADSYIFTVDLPGVAESDVNISLTGNRMVLSGTRQPPQREQNGSCLCSDRGYGTFSRSFTLPQGTDLDKVKAELKNGVLTVEVSKTPEAQARKIELQSNGSSNNQQANA